MFFKINLGFVWYSPGMVGGWGWLVLIGTKANLAQFQLNFQLELSLAKETVLKSVIGQLQCDTPLVLGI